MRIRLDIFVALLALATLPACLSFVKPAQVDRFDILTINVRFVEQGKPLGDRLSNLVDQLDALIKRKFITEPDAILVQELPRGLLAEEEDSPQLLQDLLEGRGLRYNFRTAYETGVPVLFSTANAIYVREPHEILAKLVKFLPVEEIKMVGALEIPVTRNVIMVLIKANGQLVSLYNTHLCAGGCTDEQRAEQNDAALDFIDNVEDFLDALNLEPRAVVYGGDLNTDIFRDGDTIYRTILDEGFFDGYFTGQINAEEVEKLIDLCPENPELYEDGVEHCTTGVTPLDISGRRERIDYVFLRDFDAGRAVSTVIFNSVVDDSEPIPPDANDEISDHAGVFAGAEPQVSAD